MNTLPTDRKRIIENLGFRQEAMTGLLRYLDLLWRTNDELNLISRQMTFSDLIDNHVVDCLLPLQFFPDKTLSQVADFGSGGGLPGVIYALQFPHIHFHLFEKSPKKQEFLRQCLQIAPNMEIHGEISQDLPQIDLVMARGFKPLDVILDVSRKYANQSGKYFLLKGRKTKIDEELLLLRKKFKGIDHIQVDFLPSPVLDVERHLVRIGFIPIPFTS